VQKNMLFTHRLKTVSAVLLLSFLLFGCSTPRQKLQQLPQTIVPPAYKHATESYWWRCQFRIAWPENSRIDWGMDLLLAHAVISPVLQRHYRDISYWRFHRRAARDNAGHQFSFIFYSEPETAASIYRDIGTSAILKRAEQAGLVEKVITGDPENPRFPNIEDTSDPSWPLDLQRNWPSFIMGVSSLWLGLIAESMPEPPEQSTDISILLETYRSADAQVTLTWRNMGQHALLHHLNAVFGYTPLTVRKMLTF
jgi:hypothetical protein